MWAMIAVSIALAAWCAGLSWFHHRDDMKRRVEGVGNDAGSRQTEEDTGTKFVE